MLSIWTVGVISGNFGLPGKHVGMYTGRGTRKPFGISPGANPQMETLMGTLYDFTKITTPSKYSPIITTYTTPQVLWPDMVKNGGTGHSDYNDGQIKRMTVPVKAIFS